MIVRRDGCTGVVVDESPSYYIVQLDAVYLVTAWPKRECQEVTPEPKWRDVSSECEALDNQIIHKTMKNGQAFCAHVTDEVGSRYRLTKISGPLTPHVAFIVEKQE